MSTTPEQNRRRDGVYFQTVFRYSSKVYDFFGISPSSTPSSLSRLLTRESGRGEATVPGPAGTASIDTTSNRVRISRRHIDSSTASEPVAASELPTVLPVQNGHVIIPAPGRISPPAANRHQAAAHAHLNGLSSPRYFPSPRRSRTHSWAWRRSHPNPRLKLDESKTRKTRRRGMLRALVQDFGTFWFTYPFNLGLIALTLHLLPPRLHFPGLFGLTRGVFIAELALFALFSLVCITRLVLTLFASCEELCCPLTTRRRDANAPVRGVRGADEAAVGRDMVGCFALWPAAWLTLVAFAVVVVAPGSGVDGAAAAAAAISSSGNGHHACRLEDGASSAGPCRSASSHRLALAACGAWWAGAGWTGASTVYVAATLFSPSRPRPRPATPEGRFAPSLALLQCTVAAATVALVGGLLVLELGAPGNRPGPVIGGAGTRVVSGAAAIPRGLVAPVVVFSICAVGAALLVALAVDAVLVHELVLVTGWPPPAQTATVFLLVGPFALCAAALQLLGDAVNTVYGGAVGGGLDVVEADPFSVIATIALPLDMVCILLALLLTGAAVVWLVLAIVAALYRAGRGELAWHPSWNFVVFPAAALAISMLRFGVELQSFFFGVFGCVLLVFSVVVFCADILFTLRWTLRGKMLVYRVRS
ncbi:voltage-dependent anion channel-domain-containing protein [Lasiosphaeria miniovina]|uniref:Voltage-dependent anion channel-domain-containing protein n=1 Tax=Lasiosphaeria miniovina TaxID=1954250 RepID=A0AA40E6J1_9PEZI|nr:voltage-dependent anion channel-domain-containing protein [Lasiosphaeria miniovina]KAK0726892.1 voltage-dependent anion channel-domain-containing protein [Lasiosphaeria miniovina]